MYSYEEVISVIGIATALIVGGVWVAVSLVKGGK